ncbi:MAG: 3-phosphoshikimate 1-carboxyvinyltransferase [Lachnospiraceae bacterium]|nr:3-phosphoshikimate 1-carboxyvinyltransferase [Lachnospiraceae bacterium]
MKLSLSAPSPDYRLEGERLCLRPITEEDIDEVLAWRNAPQTVQNFYYRKPITRSEQEQWIRTKVASGTVHQFIVFLKETGQDIGCVYLQHFDTETRCAESGVFFDPEAPAGQGYGTEAVKLLNFGYAFGVLGLHQTIARVQSHNTASRKLHQRAGFLEEGTIVHDIFLDGAWVDTVCFRLYVPQLEIPCVSEKRGSGEPAFAAALREGVTVPGSKSITNRALLMAMLADGETELSGVLFSDDSRHFLQCARDLGFEVQVDEAARKVSICGLGGALPKEEASLNVGSAGTAARFLTAVLGVSKGTFHLDASEQMRRRPMAPLIRTLRDLGCEIRCEAEEDHFPFTITGKGCDRYELEIEIGQSSQFLSGLLISAPLIGPEILTDPGAGVRIRALGSHGGAYIRITREMMRSFGVETESETGAEGETFVIPFGQQYRAIRYAVEPDMSAAAYYYAMCPLLGVPVMVRDIHFDSLQGDIAFLRILERMGCRAEETAEGIALLPPEGALQGISVDMSACSDQAITLAAVAPFAEGPVEITGIGHIRLQECDRLHGIAQALASLGIRTEEGEDRIVIYPGRPTGGVVDTLEDHRMAMGFSLVGLRVPGVVIDNPYCCRKTYENYFSDLAKIFDN